jgi:hypothetical protein
MEADGHLTHYNHEDPQVERHCCEHVEPSVRGEKLTDARAKLFLSTHILSNVTTQYNVALHMETRS